MAIGQLLNGHASSQVSIATGEVDPAGCATGHCDAEAGADRAIVTISTSSYALPCWPTKVVFCAQRPVIPNESGTCSSFTTSRIISA